MHRVVHSFYGNAARAIREDEECALSLGLRTRLIRVQIYTLHAAITGAAGALYAHSRQFIGPDNFVQSSSRPWCITGVDRRRHRQSPGRRHRRRRHGCCCPRRCAEIGNLRALVFGMVLFLLDPVPAARSVQRGSRAGAVSPRHAEQPMGAAATRAMSERLLQVSGLAKHFQGLRARRRRELRRRPPAS